MQPLLQTLEQHFLQQDREQRRGLLLKTLLTEKKKDWKEIIIVRKGLRLIIKTSLDSFLIGLKQIVGLVAPSVVFYV